MGADCGRPFYDDYFPMKSLTRGTWFVFGIHSFICKEIHSFTIFATLIWFLVSSDVRPFWDINSCQRKNNTWEIRNKRIKDN